MAKKSVLRQIGDSIKAAGTAVADVAQAAITASSDLPEDGGFSPVKNQQWAREIETTGAKKSTAKKKSAAKKSPAEKATAKKAKKKKVKKTVKKASKKSKKKKL